MNGTWRVGIATTLMLVTTLVPAQSQPGAPVGDKITPPSLPTAQAPCFYPTEARSENTEGDTSLSFTIDTDGKVIDLVVAKSSGNKSLDEAAQGCVRSRIYAPAKKNGQPIPVPWHAVFHWRLAPN